ncbi:MAG: single-stranded DNA-binding protein [Endomicrobium sp.]|jgi:single-strand DNA-binding protein|nr:single-stranded DNA-binding protein [Endomicrobium sp.]
MMQQNNLRLPEQNIVIMVGRLTRDPDFRRTATGKAVCSFDIAVSKRIKDSITGEWRDADPAFVPIVVWGDQAERCGERLKKGVPVHVEGRLRTNKWEASDGSKRSRLEVIASRVQFLIRRDNVAADVKPADNDNAVGSGIDSDEDEDIPF